MVARQLHSQRLRCSRVVAHVVIGLARPPFAMDRLKQQGADLVYRCGKGHNESQQSDKCSGELVRTPLELIERLAQSSTGR